MPEYTQRDGYHVLIWVDRRDLWPIDILRTMPELVISNYGVCTSFDSGPLRLADEELANGWQMVGDLAHSPRLTDSDQLPFADGYDEYLIFPKFKKVNKFDTLVNYTPFPLFETLDEPELIELREKFWRQILKLRPMHIIGVGDFVYVITSDAAMAVKLQQLPV